MVGVASASQGNKEAGDAHRPTQGPGALVSMGPARAIAAINHSVGNGWQGIFEANGESNHARNSHRIGPGQRHPDDTTARSQLGKVLSWPTYSIGYSTSPSDG